MKATKTSTKVKAVARVDIGSLLPASTRADDKIKGHLATARRNVDRLRKVLDELSEKLKELEAEDRLGNFEIQDLMSRFNQAETLASSVTKKRDDTANAVISKI